MDTEAYAKHNKPEAGAKPGVYKHSGTTDELHAATFPAADAFVRQGWVYDRPLPKAEVTRGVVPTEPAVSVEEVKKLREELKAEKLARQTAEAEAEKAKAETETALEAAAEAEKANASVEVEKKGK